MDLNHADHFPALWRHPVHRRTHRPCPASSQQREGGDCLASGWAVILGWKIRVSAPGSKVDK